jgi:hypothetical protein
MNDARPLVVGFCAYCYFPLGASVVLREDEEGLPVLFCDERCLSLSARTDPPCAGVPYW